VQLPSQGQINLAQKSSHQEKKEQKEAAAKKKKEEVDMTDAFSAIADVEESEEK